MIIIIYVVVVVVVIDQGLDQCDNGVKFFNNLWVVMWGLKEILGFEECLG